MAFEGLKPVVIFRPRKPAKGAGTLRRAVRSQAFAKIPGGRHMECAYYFDFLVGCVERAAAI